MSDEILIVTETEQLVETNSITEQLVLVEIEQLTETVLEIVEIVESEVLIETAEPVLEILDLTEPTEILELGIQGPPGPPGTGTALVYTAAIAISGHTVFTLDADGNALPADPMNVAHANTITGISLGAAVAGGQITAITSGPLSHSGWAFTPGLPVFVGLGGVVTQSPPAAAWQKAIGVARSATVIVVELQPAIF